MIEPTKTCIEPLRTGRYIGGDGQWWMELRALDDVLSLDVTPVDSGLTGNHSAAATTGAQESLVRGDDGARVGVWPLEVTAPERSRCDGRLVVTTRKATEGEPPGKVDALVTWEGPGARSERIELSLTWTGECARELGVEIEIEQRGDGTTQTLPAVTIGEKRYDWVSVLRTAGIDARQVGETTTIRREDVRASLGLSTSAEETPWSAVEALRGLHDLMRRTSQADLTRPAWRSHLLVLSRSGRKGLLGLMFDVDGLLPRQGCAVFADEIRELPGIGDRADFEILRTIAHEIGHTLNLPHRFQRGFAASTSVMNYPWTFRGGNHAAEYYAACRFGFDPDELAFLHHAPRANVIPGGAISEDLHPGWRTDPGHRSPRDPSLHLDLWLSPPAGGTTILPGEPVFLGVNVANVGARPLVLPRHALDVKAGHLRLRITRDGQEAGAHRPVMQRCYGLGNRALIRLGVGESLHDNVNLTMGAAGLVFAETGTYEITPWLTVPDRVASRTRTEDVSSEYHVVVGRPLAVTVRATRDAGLDAEFVQAMRPEAALGVMIAAPAWSSDARSALAHAEKLAARRAKREAGVDRFGAALARARAIEALRDGDREADSVREAAELLGGDRVGVGATFDPHTREQTALLLASQRPPDTSRRVVVDLGYGPRGARVEKQVVGYLDVVASGVAPGVVAPLAGVPPGALTSPDARVSVIATAADGLVQRLHARTVKVITDAGTPVAAVVALSRSLTPADLEAGPPDPAHDADAVWRGLVERRAVPSDTPALQELASPADVADPTPRAPEKLPRITTGEVDISGVAGLAFLCWIVPWCSADEDDPFRPDGTRPPPSSPSERGAATS